MCKTKRSSKDCNRCLFNVAGERVSSFIINFEQVIKPFLVWNIYFIFLLSVVDCTFYKNNIESNCILLLSQYKSEAVVRRCSVKKVLLEIPQRLATLFKKRFWHNCFPVNFAKFLKTFFLTEYFRWLLLAFQSESTLYSFRTSCSKQALYIWTGAV